MPTHLARNHSARKTITAPPPAIPTDQQPPPGGNTDATLDQSKCKRKRTASTTGGLNAEKRPVPREKKRDGSNPAARHTPTTDCHCSKTPPPHKRHGAGTDHPGTRARATGNPENKIRILIGCECSGIVRDAFRKRGHDAYSCDLQEAETPSDHHIKASVLDVLADGWELAIFHPPCTHLAVSGAKHFKKKQRLQEEALQFVAQLMQAPIERWALENPVSVISTRIRPPDQIIQPWQHGHGETKATCLWLKNLPNLKPTNIVEGREPRIHMMAPSPTRGQERSRTLQGIAEAMAEQWGNPRLPLQQSLL